jgi:hypothetical protein
MATTKRDGLPDFWATGVAKLLVGDQPCRLRTWLPGHFKIEKRPQDDSSALTRWKIRHTEALNAAVAKFKAEGWKCQVEQFFKVHGQTAILTGKVDLITQKKDCRPTIRDAKGGEPSDADVAQVQIYQVAIPLAWNSPTMQFDGEVIYPTHTVKISAAEAQAIKPKLFALLRQLGSTERPPASPSESTCRFCEIGSDCTERWVGNNVVPTTDEF